MITALGDQQKYVQARKNEGNPTSGGEKENMNLFTLVLTVIICIMCYCFPVGCMCSRLSLEWTLDSAGQNGRLEQKVQNKGNVSHELCLHSH